MKKTCWKIFKEHFPENKSKWFLYFKFSVPIIIAGIIFSLNAFIDNFMVTSIAHGVDALSYANAWTGIVSGLITGISAICSVLIGQYWGSKQYEKVKEVMRLRVLITFICSLIFAIFALFFTREMISVFYQGTQDEATMQKAVDYLRLITITWLIFSWTWPTAGLLAETGHGKESLISTSASLIINIVLNSIFIYVFNWGIEGAAYASIVARLFGIFGDTFFIYLKIKIVIITPWSLFKVSKNIWVNFLIRIHSALLFAGVTILIVLRNSLFNKSYPQGSIGNPSWAIGAASILGLSGAISQIFLSTFSALSSNMAIFVGSFLGQKNFKQAVINSKELKGFHASVALILSSILIIIAIFMPYFNFLAIEIGKNSSNALLAQSKYLKEVQISLIIIALFNPLWLWFTSSARAVASGGKTNLVAIFDFFLETIALSWLLIITFLIKPQQLGWSFAFTSFIFYLVDLIKLIVYEIVFWKVEWAQFIENK